MEINVQNFSSEKVYYHLSHLMASKPAVTISTISPNGTASLNTFSFFNFLSCDPPIPVFSPTQGMPDDIRKHLLRNVTEVPQVVINFITKDINRPITPEGDRVEEETDEFLKAGFEKERAVKIKPPLVKEAKAKLECNVIKVKPLGNSRSSGLLIICEVIYIHIDDEVIDEDDNINLAEFYPAATSQNLYNDMNPDNLYLVVLRPKNCAGIGIDNLPSFITNSGIIKINDLARLASIERLPCIDTEFTDVRINSIIRHCRHSEALIHNEFCEYAIELLNSDQIQKAWQVLWKLHAINNNVKPNQLN